MNDPISGGQSAGNTSVTMNGEVPNVPITTLAGITSVTNLLPELPLPTPLPHTVNNKSLLYHPDIAAEAKRILGHPDENVVRQLVQALSHSSTDHIELKDNMAGDSIEGELPELLKAVLGADPNVFKGHNASKVDGVVQQPYNQHNQHPSPYQAGQISPCPPGSPARYPPNQIGGSPFGVFAQSPYNHNPPGQSGQKASTSNFQQQFLNFAAGGSGDVPTVNGGMPGNSSSKGRMHNNKPCTASSPAQAAAAPYLNEPMKKELEDSPRVDGLNKSLKAEPVVVIKPMSDEDINLATRRAMKEEVGQPRSSRSKSSETIMQPRIQLTRLESIPQSEIDAKLKDKKKKSHNISSAGSSLTLKISKSKDGRGHKRHRADADEWTPGNESLQDIYGEFATNMSDRVKKRRRIVQMNESDDSDENRKRSPSPEVQKRKKDRNKKRVNDTPLSAEELMDTATFKRFSSAIDTVLESAEDFDLSVLDADEEDAAHHDDAVVSRSTLIDLCNEAAKLKSMGCMNQVPYEKLVKLMAIMQLNIKDGSRVIPFGSDDDNRDESVWRELAMEKVLSAMDASLTALYIMTSPNMPKQVYLEDVIERLVMMMKVHTQNTIFPEFDPVYKLDPKNKHGGSIKMKRARAGGAKHKSTINLYNKLTELVGVLAELIDIQELTDTIILQASTLSVAPFFVENISELQLNSLKLVTNIFARYEKHRQLILEDVLSSLARLPSSKKNLRSYRLNSEEQIQMVTALALQLIQCVVKLPMKEEEEDPGPPPETEKEKEKEKKRKKEEMMDKEVIIITSYENAMRTAHNFLAVFLRKCAMKGEEDYRPLFENFVYDLLATVNKPEWPAAELLLSLLGRLLVQQFSNKSVDMSLRVASLDYLGIVAARLRRDAVTSRLNVETIDDIISHVFQEDDESDSEKEKEEKEKEKERKKKKKDDDEEETDESQENDNSKTQSLQKALLEYLVYNAQNDPALVFSRQFYVAQWYRDCSVESEKINKLQKKLKNRDEDELEKFQKNIDLLQENELRKGFLLEQIDVKGLGVFAMFKPNPSKLDYDRALLVTRYLASNRPFSQSFDIYLTQILKVLCETAVAVRTKAMKCLSAVVEADPGILARNDMQKGVHGRLLDHSTSVREAAVELVGKFLLIRPELTSQYYDMLSERILDTGISVRKRVIRIFRDICVEQPDFPKIPEICVKMIRRVNDEEGIKKLVSETFQAMWLTPEKAKETQKLIKKVMNITDVVAACQDYGFEWLEQLLETLLKKEEETNQKPVFKACVQIVDCLVENVLRLEETSESSTPRLISCLSTLYLFCKVKPELLTGHALTIQPYLNIRCNSQTDIQVIHNVSRILELSVPLMEHPGESFLAQLEEDMMKHILKRGPAVLQSCVSCLGAVVNKVTHNYILVRDCLMKFFGVLAKDMKEQKQNPAHVSNKPTLLRSLFTVGLLCKHFDFDAEQFGEKKASVKDRVFDVIMHFTSHPDEEVQLKALLGLGFFCVRHFEYMLHQSLRDLYYHLLTDGTVSLKMRVQVLRNLQTYLVEEELKMMVADAEWKKNQQKEDLKEMGDVQSGMASTVIQVYLKQTLEAFFHPHPNVRMAGLSVIILVLKQGLVHPVQCVPFLICMGTDCDSQARIKADQQLQEIDKKYSGFIQMKAMQGLKFSFKLQQLVQINGEAVRGFREDENNLLSLNNYLYSLIRSNRNHRRALLGGILNMFDDTAKVPLDELVYMADNLAYFPYVQQEEPLYIIHQIDILVSVSGSNLLQSFQEYFYPGRDQGQEGKKIDDDEDEEIDVLVDAVTRRFEAEDEMKKAQDVQQLQDLYMASQGCVLLLVLKQHLKEMYGFTDAKIHRYSPTDSAKAFEKGLNRRSGVRFNPKQVLDIIKGGPITENIDLEGKKLLVEAYLEFKDLMLSIDPDDQEDDENPDSSRTASGTAAHSGGKAPGVDLNSSGHEPQLDADGNPIPNANPQNSGVATPKVSTPVSNHQSHHRHHHSHSRHHSHGLHSSDRKRGRPPGSTNKHKSKHHSKPHKHKKKKKKRKLSDSEGENSASDNESDPDWS